MAASDTAVGIVGSVVLVAVMVGVFVYEYNNAPDVETEDPNGSTTGKSPGDSMSGSIGPTGQSSLRFAMIPDEGVTAVLVSVGWTPTAGGLPVGPAGQYAYQLFDAENNVITEGTTDSDLSYTISAPTAQEYVLVISLPDGGAGGDLELEAAYEYVSEAEA